MGSGEQVATDVAFLSIAGQPSRFSPTDAAFTTQNSDCYLRTSSFLENRRLDSVSFPKIPKRSHRQGRADSIRLWQKRDLSVLKIARGCGPRVSWPSQALPTFVDVF